MKIDSPYSENVIDPAITSYQIDNGNGLSSHVLVAGNPEDPCVLLLHGFPELAFSWRKVMLPLAAAGYHVIAPDQRGYGRTIGSDNRFNGDVASFRLYNLVQDALGVVAALGHKSVHSVVGHDFGSSVAAWCAVTRPDIFNSVVLMSAPFAGTPKANSTQNSIATIDHDALAQLNPPRKHYQWYYSTQEANNNMQQAAQGIHNFLRAYYHCKSADWADNNPHELKSWAAEELALLPTYYVMHKSMGMAETVATEMPDTAVIESNNWLTETELAIYAAEFQRTGFQGGLNWYRCVTSGQFNDELRNYSGKTIDIPCMFIAGACDWGIYQKPDEYQAMQSNACSDFKDSHLISGAGHWVQQEQPNKVTEALLQFFKHQ